MEAARILKNALDNPTGSQRNKILNHLWVYGRIDPITAMNKHSVYRLAARICDLNKFDFYIMNVNAHGETALYVINNVTRRNLEQQLNELTKGQNND